MGAESMNEVWRMIPGLEGRYEVSSLGRISKWENGIVPKSINDAFKLIELGERFGVSVPRSSRKVQRK